MMAFHEERKWYVCKIKVHCNIYNYYIFQLPYFVASLFLRLIFTIIIKINIICDIKSVL